MKTINILKYIKLTTQFLRKQHGTITKAFKWAGIGAVGIWLGAIVAQTSPAPVPLGSVVVIAQVVNSASGNAGSTSSINSDDVVQVSSTISSFMPSPVSGEGEMVLPGPPYFGWQPGSFVAPPKTTMRWMVDGSNTWTTTEPAVGTPIKKVGWSTNPLITIKAGQIGNGAISFAGTGDGYRVIPYKDRLYVVNHHINGGYLNCRLASDGSACPNFGVSSGLSFPLTNNTTATFFNNEYFTPNRSVEHLDRTGSSSDGNLYTYLANRNGKIIVACVNLNTLTSCMNSVTMDTNRDNGQSQSALNVMGSIGSKYYAVSAKGLMLCFDSATKAKCANPSINFFFGGYMTSISMMADVGTKIFLSISEELNCFDTLTNDRCVGFGKNGVWAETNKLRSNAQVYRVLSPTGTVIGICSTVGCRTLAGVAFQPQDISQNYKNFLENNQFFTSNSDWVESNTFGTRVFHGKSGEQTLSFTNCFDFATNSVCPGFENLNLSDSIVHPDGRKGPRVYSSVVDPTRANCMWSLGDPAYARPFNPLTGGDCPNEAIVPPKIPLEINPGQSYKCDNTLAKVKKWGSIRFSPSLPWNTAVGGGITGMTATIKRWDGVANSTTNPVIATRPFVNGSYSLNISDIDYVANPMLQIELNIVGATRPVQSDIGFDVTWEGDPIQICANIKAPNLDKCSALPFSTQHVNSRIDVPSDSETLKDKTGAGANVVEAGAGPATTSTTLRKMAEGGSDPTKALQTRFNMSNLGGDLLQYNINTAGALAASPASQASSVVVKSPSRVIFTSTAASSNFGAGSPVALNFNTLNAAQKDALNKNLLGVVDNKGADRVAYLAGDRSKEIGTAGGTFRKRGAPTATTDQDILGTAINSSPVILAAKPLATYNDSLFPNYKAFKFATSRDSRLALYQGNDGLLHAYKVATSANSSLSEAFSYMPGMLLRSSQLQRYTDGTQVQLRGSPYWLDNTPLVADVNLGEKAASQWASVVVGSQGRGGRGLYGINVTTGLPTQTLFEYDNTSHPDLADLGFIQGQPPASDVTGADQLVRLKNGRWVFVTGNGVDSAKGAVAGSTNTGKAVLYMFYLGNFAGPRWIKVHANPNNIAALNVDNGLSTPTPVDTDGDGDIDLVYAGDIQGNMWRFNVRDPAAVVVTQIFKTANGQPINVAPVVQNFRGGSGCSNPRDCWMVVFGTGAAINPLSDTTDFMGATQAIYGVLDRGTTGTTALVSSANMVQQTLGSNQTVSGVTFRKVSKEIVEYKNGKLGWFINLPNQIQSGTTSLPEHVSANLVRQSNGSVLIASTFANSSAASCKASYLTQVNMTTGQGTVETLLKDGETIPDVNSRLNGGEPTLGISILRNSTLNSTKEEVLTTQASAPLTQRLKLMIGRVSWREVFGLPK